MKNLWGGRFREPMDPTALAYSETIAVDSEMLLDDVWGSEAHAIMLGACRIVTGDDLRQILTGLLDIEREAREGRFVLNVEDEDVHMNVERHLTGRVGAAGGRLHTARSRNDQVITDTRVHTRGLIMDIEAELIELQKVLLAFAERHVDTITVGYTHTQHAQPISLGFWATAYVQMLMRDLTRLVQAYEVTNVNPLGAGAMSGTAFPIDRRITTALLGFDAVQEHGLDAVSSRDFAAQLLGALAILMSNLSKIAEELVYWSTYEYGTVQMSDAFSMGSSIMPQKKNPCIAELLRGRTGRAYGLLMELLTNLKGTPTGYNRDLQEDKPPIWQGARLAISSLGAARGMLQTLRVDEARMRQLAGANFATATELADHLVRARDLPFRECHRIVGRLVSELIAAGSSLEDVARARVLLGDLGVDVSEDELRDVLAVERVVDSHRSTGGTAREEVTRMVVAGRARLDAHEQGLVARRESVRAARARTSRVAEAVVAGRPVHEALEPDGVPSPEVVR
jgi:argininosuccinate lyase